MNVVIRKGDSPANGVSAAPGAAAIAQPTDNPTPSRPDVAREVVQSDPAGGPAPFARVGRSMRIGARFGAGAALGVWLADVAVLASTRSAVGWRHWLTGVGAALFVALTTALVLGALLGPVFVPMTTGMVERLRGRLGGLRDGDPDACHTLAAQALGVAGLLCVWSFLAYRVALATELDFAGPKSMAGALTVSHLMFAATLAVAWPSGVRLARRLVELASSVPGLRWLTARGWRIPCFLAVGALFGGGAVLMAHRTELVALPWQRVVSLPGIVLGLAGAYYLPRARGPGGRHLARAALALIGAGLVGGMVVAARLRPESTAARKLAFERALSGYLGYAAWTAALDFDGDGQLGILGGGDCAPFDPRRYTGAVDVPGNGIDEDCDGADMPPLVLGARPRMQVGQDSLPLRPTVVLVTIDGLGAPRLLAFGGHTSLMPHVDDLAARSMRFAHCFSEGPSTRLSFPSMFTSRYDSQLTHLFAPAHPYPLAPSERQLQDVLNDAGYETAAVIPNQYFDSSHWSSVTRGFHRVDTSAIVAGKHNAPQVTDAALRLLSEAQDRPLYLWVHYYDAHGPYEPPPGVALVRPTEEVLYDAELTYIDRELGRLIAALDQRSQPTYVILTADHATVFHPDPSTRRGHYGYDLYSATLHVPLLVRGPGIPAGRVDGVVSTMDIAASIADLLRLSSAGLEGTSLLPEMLAGKSDPQRVLFHEFYLPERGFRGEDPLQMVSVRSGHYNLVLDRTRASYELYDWTADYFEQRDLYEDQARSPEVLQLRSLVGFFVQKFHDWGPGGTLRLVSND
jgi:arylsulfatase A-like enzyme